MGVQPPYVQPAVGALQLRYKVDGRVVKQVDIVRALGAPGARGDTLHTSGRCAQTACPTWCGG
eukprot:6081867-Alexandrium_andersonii.AAC.1